MYNNFIVLNSMRNNNTYDGTTLKFGITVDNEKYIVKFGKDSISSLYSEYVASRFIKRLGVSCHEVYLGYYQDNAGVTTPVNIIKDFTSNTIHLRSYKAVGQYYEYTDVSTKQYTYKDVTHMIEEHRKLYGFDKQRMLEHFWDMFICDAILANRDRHWGNWGYLTDGVQYKPAPLYDNGGCLFPDVARRIAEFPLDERKFIYERAERYPASLFQMERDGKVKRTNYYEILGDLRINRILASRVRGIKKIGFENIYLDIVSVVNDVASFIPADYRKFYVYITCVRYLHLIERLSLEEAFNITEKRYMKDGK